MSRTIKGSKGPGHDFDEVGGGYTFGTGRFVKRITTRKLRRAAERAVRNETKED